MNWPQRICVCTSYAAHAEPRAPRHARTLADCTDAHVTLIDAAPAGAPRVSVECLDGVPRIEWTTHRYSHRGQGIARLAVDKAQSRLAQAAYRTFGRVAASALSTRIIGMERLLRRAKPDLIMAHNIDALLPAHRAARALGAALVFDSMEFHSDMGDEQDAAQVRLVEHIERKCLSACDLVTTSSSHVADALREKYGVTSTVALYNAPRRIDDVQAPKVAGFALYWRNSTVGLGQRGLGDMIEALALLPDDVTLHVQGRPAPDGGREVLDYARRWGVENRVVVHPPYRAERAVHEAARFHVGLCLERRGVRNHDLTVSNKMFDYHMAGLAVVASDLAALGAVIERSSGGLTYRAGDARDLARVIRRLYDAPDLYRRLAANARQFAWDEGNLEHEMGKFRAAISELVAKRRTQENISGEAVSSRESAHAAR